jgi:large subunit ribosomal protein L21
MYAIVDIAGQQFKVEEGQKIFVHRLDVEEGDNIEFDKVLLIENDGKITVGEPVIKDALIEGKILDHIRGDKVIIFKKKRKKGYRIKNGHRQNFTQVEIVSINEKGGPRKPVVKKGKNVVAEAPATESVLAEKKPAARKAAVKKTEVKTPAVKKTAEKKTTEKKTTEKKPAASKPVAKKAVESKPVAKKAAVKKPAKGKAK